MYFFCNVSFCNRHATYLYVTLFGMELLEMQHITDIPKDSLPDTTVEKKLQYFNRICTDITLRCWGRIDQREVEVLDRVKPVFPAGWKAEFFDLPYNYCRPECREGIYTMGGGP